MDQSQKIKTFQKINSLTGKMTQSWYRFISVPVLRLLAKGTLRQNRAEKKSTAEAVAREWQRMFGIDDYFKVTDIRDDETLCEIHFDCILENTGDVKACHRLMEYDRAIIKAIGGNMTILQSRADPSVSGPCRISIRL